ncbi:MlaD family protein [Nocardia crassostreae]|uniref:MlaD family protein n=1 Tax=Nocardia crassostreae TaxID=53428 RepID=UPI00082F608F|nr:MlaD family protein [Nocardia crassostreae]
MRKFVASQGFVTVVGVALAALVTVVGYVLAVDPVKKTVAYCALMPDAVGLYPGNHVTMRGIPIGTVRTVRPEGLGVRVDFDIDAARRLRGTPTATTVSDTLVADRSLAVLGEPGAKNTWNPGACIEKTFTPKSISQTLDAFTDLAAKITDDPGDRNRLKDSVEAFQQATAGTGPQLNRLVQDMGTALHRPDAAIGHLGSMLDAFGALMESISANWDDIKNTLLQAGPGITFINEVWQDDVKLVDSLLVIIPWLNDIAREHGVSILHGLDAAIPKLRLLSAHIGSLQQIIDMIPPIVSAFQRSVDPATGQPRLTYAPPKVALPQENADQVCAVVNAAMPGRCRADNGLADVDLVPLVLGLAGVR